MNDLIYQIRTLYDDDGKVVSVFCLKQLKLQQFLLLYYLWDQEQFHDDELPAQNHTR